MFAFGELQLEQLKNIFFKKPFPNVDLACLGTTIRLGINYNFKPALQEIMRRVKKKKIAQNMFFFSLNAAIKTESASGQQIT